MPENRYVVGVDFGTLSGRALVVRVADGAELGTAVHEYATGVIDTRLPAIGVRLRPDWALQDPEDCGRGAAHGRTRPLWRPAASTRARSSASEPTSPPAPCCRCCADGTPLC